MADGAFVATATYQLVLASEDDAADMGADSQGELSL